MRRRDIERLRRHAAFLRQFLAGPYGRELPAALIALIEVLIAELEAKAAGA